MTNPGEKGYLAERGVKLKFIKTMDDIAEFKRWLGERRSYLGYDTETEGFSIERDRVRLAQFGDLHTGWAIPWDDYRGVVVEALNVYEGDLVLHNSKYDIRMTTQWGGPKLKAWPWHRTNDTMNAAHLVDPLRLKGLKPLAARLVDPMAAGAQQSLHDAMTKQKWTWKTIPLDFPDYWIYAAMDPVLTCYIAEHLMPTIKSTYAYPYDLEMGTTRVISKMEARGARVDLEYSTRKMHELRTFVAQASDWLRAEHGITSVNSGAQLLRFFEANGVSLPDKRTASGAQSMDKSVIEMIDHPVAKMVLAIRKAEKNVGPYFSNFIEMADTDDVVHPNIWTLGTRTGRMSITDPALQTLPRKDPTVRTAFVPREGNSLITCDYDQVEARLMAHFSQSQGLIDAFLGEDDFFCTIASQIFGRPIGKKDPERQLTKNTVYGKLYGAGVDKMAETAGVDSDVMASVVDGFDSRFPEVKAIQKQVTYLGYARARTEGSGWVRTPTGRRIVSDPGKEYTLVNYLIQGHAAEILKRKLVELDSILPEGSMILPVHDEIVFDVPAEDAVELQKIIQDTMSITDGSYAVPVTASSDLLRTDWGEKYR